MKKSANMVRTTIRVDKDEFECFKRYAKNNHSDVSKEMRKMISDYIKRYETRRKFDMKEPIAV